MDRMYRYGCVSIFFKRWSLVLTQMDKIHSETFYLLLVPNLPKHESPSVGMMLKPMSYLGKQINKLGQNAFIV